MSKLPVSESAWERRCLEQESHVKVLIGQLTRAETIIKIRDSDLESAQETAKFWREKYKTVMYKEEDK